VGQSENSDSACLAPPRYWLHSYLAPTEERTACDETRMSSHYEPLTANRGNLVPLVSRVNWTVLQIEVSSQHAEQARFQESQYSSAVAAAVVVAVAVVAVAVAVVVVAAAVAVAVAVVWREKVVVTGYRVHLTAVVERNNPGAPVSVTAEVR
jgi:hypothetical protein